MDTYSAMLTISVFRGANFTIITCKITKVLNIVIPSGWRWEYTSNYSNVNADADTDFEK